VNSFNLEPHQTDVLAVLRALGARLGWKGEVVVVEGALVYQIPLPNDPNVSGAFFVIEANERNIRLYLTLPWNAPKSQIVEASEFVIRCGYGLRFGALDLDLDHGSLRVRMDTDPTEDALEESVTRLFDRAMALGREVSPGWRAIVCEGVKTAEALGRSALESEQ
jgi:hypothetical protein